MSKIVEGIAKDLKSIPEKLKAILEQLHDRESPAAPDDTTDNTNDGQ